jgi:hypothetical protein
MRRVEVIVTAATAAAITMVAVACGSGGTASGSSAPSATAGHSASSPAQASTALCQDYGALQASLADLVAHVSGGKGGVKQVPADLQDVQPKLSVFTGGAHGMFSVQIKALKSALTTLQTAVNGVRSGSGSAAEVRTAGAGATTAATNLAAALAQAGCTGPLD